MRAAPVLKVLAIVVFVALVLIAFLDPDAFADVRDRASQNALWLALSLLAAGCGAKLTLAVPAFGEHAHVSAPLFLTLAAPYLLRFMAWDAFAKRLRPPFVRQTVATESLSRRYPSGAPTAMPARIATALEAAARARRGIDRRRCPSPRPPL